MKKLIAMAAMFAVVMSLVGCQYWSMFLTEKKDEKE